MVKLCPALRVRSDSSFYPLSRVPALASIAGGNRFAALPIGARRVARKDRAGSAQEFRLIQKSK